MSKVLVWDLPTRLFHLLMILLVFGAFSIAHLASHRGPWFRYHMLLGLIFGSVLVLRLLWGVAGSRYARFKSLLFSPQSLMQYITGVFTGKAPRFVGHNPGSGYVILILFVLGCAVVSTGLLMATGSEAAEEAHGLLANVMLGFVAAHVLGVVIHMVRHRENILLGVITGYKAGEPQDEIASARPTSAILFLALLVFFAWGVLHNYNPEKHTTTLPLVGTTVHLGER